MEQVVTSGAAKPAIREAEEFRRFAKRRIAILLAIHAVVCFVLGALSENSPTIPTGLFVGVVFAHASLVGMWASLSRRRFFIRFAAGVFAMLVVGAILCMGLNDWNSEIFALVSIATSLVFSVGSAIRFFARIETLHDAKGKREGIRFSIKHLLIATTVAAVVMGVVRAVDLRIQSTDMIVGLGIAAGAIGITSIWAMLGTGVPFFRSLFVISVSIAAGSHLGMAHGDYVFWMMVYLVSAITILLTLYAVRIFGFRLVARGNAVLTGSD